MAYLQLSKAFPANFAGICKGCGERFEVGANIRYVEGEVQADECCGSVEPLKDREEDVTLFSPAEVARARAEACPRCFVSHKGEC